MSHKDELEETTKRKIEKLSKGLAGIKVLSELAPLLDEKKKEEELKLEAIKSLPEGYLEERYPSLLIVEREDEKKYDWVAAIGKTSELAHGFYNSTSGTVATYSGIAQELINIDRSTVEPMKYVLSSFAQLADSKSMKDEIPQILDKLDVDIRKKYQVAQASLERAKIGLEAISGASMNMRQFLSDLWGTIANEAIKRKPDEWKKNNIQHKMFRNQDHRILVANCISGNSVDQVKLEQTLDGMYVLFSQLSDPKFGKNLLNIDNESFSISATQWLLLIDDFIRVIEL